ncbi:hypothetical protein SHI21_02980 [Bacteriovorax sp. PP10]|uniref:Uncharacterized protein n=1 Tax=Bacteriovorax antarcticus TaxID=3088717 RepID=A0ABU5VQ31_9BACT|nr:hypothetical protein [Bacteriovorax sp. PP10]MEA9355144.1 hypothetical protein [Bacteriovorax sp. PP10]
MKSIIATLLLISSINAFALTNSQVNDLYESGNYNEKSFSEAKLPAAQKATILKKMEAVSEELANIWGDTVLEGPYNLLGDPTLDVESIRVIYKGSELVGFYGTVRADAAFTDSCEYNDEVSEEEADREFNECLQDYKGYIYENFLVNKNGSYIEEFSEPADFQD